MNTLDYSKGEISRAKTADYFPGQSATGPFYNPNLSYSRGGQNYYEGKVYAGDASRYYNNGYGYQQPAQSYEQYANRFEPSQYASLNPQVFQREQPRLQYGQGPQYPMGMGQSHPYQNQQPASYIQPQYLPQQKQAVQQSYQYQRQFLPFRPMMANEVNQVAQSKYSLQQRQTQHEEDFKVFCPACHQQYYNSQLQQHVERHYLYNTDQFKIAMEKTRAPQQQSLSNLSNHTRFYYPLIEPQQFECKELDEVDYMNKYKLQHQELNKKEANVKVKSQSTQFAKPPLQKRSDNTDIYNCLDNIFSSNNKFSVNDLTKSNSIIAKKRQLDDWEKLRSQKEGYTIKGQ